MSEAETRVVLESRDQNDFVVDRVMPSGHWGIRRQRGPIPECLRGLYSKKDIAITAIKIYLDTFARPRPIKEIK